MTKGEFHKVLASLKRIENALVELEKHSETESSALQSLSNEQSQAKEPLSVSAELSLPASVTDYYHAKRYPSWPSRLKKWSTTILEAAGVVVAAVLAFLNWRVLTEIQKQTPEITRSAAAAESATKLTFFQMKNAVAADVRFSFDLNPGGDQASVALSAVNMGKVASPNIQGKLTLHIESVPSRKQIGKDITVSLDPQRLDAYTPENGTMLNKAYFMGGLTPQSMESLRQLKSLVRLAGEFSFDDGFGSTVPRSVCRTWIAEGLSPGNPVSGHQAEVDCNAVEGPLAAMLKQKAVFEEQAKRQIEKERSKPKDR